MSNGSGVGHFYPSPSSTSPSTASGVLSSPRVCQDPRYSPRWHPCGEQAQATGALQARRSHRRGQADHLVQLLAPLRVRAPSLTSHAASKSSHLPTTSVRNARRIDTLIRAFGCWSARAITRCANPASIASSRSDRHLVPNAARRCPRISLPLRPSRISVWKGRLLCVAP